MCDPALVRLSIESVRPCTPLRIVLNDWIRGYLHTLEPDQIPPLHVPIDVTRLTFLACSLQRLESVETWDRERLRHRFPGCVAVLLYEMDRANSSLAIYGFVSLVNSARIFNRDPFLLASDVRHAPLPQADAPFLSLESSKFNSYCDPIFLTARMDPAFEAPLLTAALEYVAELTVGGRTPDMQLGRELLLRKYTRSQLCSPNTIATVGKLNYYLRLALIFIAYSGEDGALQAPAVKLGSDALAALIAGLVSIIHPTEDNVASLVSLLDLPLQVVGLDPTVDFSLCSPSGSPGQYYFPFGHQPSVEKLRKAYSAAQGQIDTRHRTWATTANAANVFPTESGISFVEVCVNTKKFKRTEPTQQLSVMYDTWPVSFYCHIRAEHADRTLRSLLSYLAFCGSNFSHESRINRAFYPVAGGWCLFCVQDIIFLGGKPELDAFIASWRARSPFEIELMPGVGRGIPCESSHFVPHLHPSALALPKQDTFGELVYDFVAVKTPAIVEATARACELAQRFEQPTPSYLLRDPETGHYFSPHALGQWVGERTAADIASVRAQVWQKHRGNKKQFIKKHYLGGMLADLYKPLSDNLAEPLLRQLNSVFAEKARAATERLKPSVPQLHSKGGSRFSSGRSFFDMQPFRSIEESVASDPARVQSYLMYLTGASRIGSASHGTGYEAISELHKIVYTMAGAPKYATSWRDWKDPTGASKGWRLGSLTKHVKRFASEQEAVIFLTDWANGNAKPSTAALPAQPVSPEMPASTLRSAAEYAQENRRIARTSTRVLPGTPAHNYLRNIRCLGKAEEGGAPRSLIEENPFLVARRAIRVGDHRRPSMSVFTSNYQVVQNTCLNEETCDKEMEFGYPKKSHGVFELADGTKEHVPLQIVPSTARYIFAAEGVETGLSFACALGRANVCALLGVSNIEGLHRAAGVHVAIWCRENDKKKEDPRAQAAAEAALTRQLKTLAGRFEQVHCVFPPSEYKDFNDVHRSNSGAAGTRIIIECLRAQLPAEIFDAVK